MFRSSQRLRSYYSKKCQYKTLGNPEVSGSTIYAQLTYVRLRRFNCSQYRYLDGTNINTQSISLQRVDKIARDQRSQQYEFKILNRFRATSSWIDPWTVFTCSALSISSKEMVTLKHEQPATSLLLVYSNNCQQVVLLLNQFTPVIVRLQVRCTARLVCVQRQRAGQRVGKSPFLILK